MQPGNTTQWEAFEWAFQQAKHLSAPEHHVLLYLVGHSFYSKNNPEQAEVGQVLYQASYLDRIVEGTGLGIATVRRALVSLQMKGYIQREARAGHGSHVPHTIYVLWEHDDLREGLRDGSRRLPEELMSIPARPKREAPKRPVLRLIRDHSS